jgi:hypothetical protein
MRVEITAEAGAGKTPVAPSPMMLMSSRPTNMGAASSNRFNRCSELSQATAVAVLANRWRMTQSTWTGGLGGITVCLMKPGNPATMALTSSCQTAKASALSGRTRVWITMVTPPLAAADCPAAVPSAPSMAESLYYGG